MRVCWPFRFQFWIGQRLWRRCLHSSTQRLCPMQYSRIFQDSYQLPLLCPREIHIRTLWASLSNNPFGSRMGRSDNHRDGECDALPYQAIWRSGCLPSLFPRSWRKMPVFLCRPQGQIPRSDRRYIQQGIKMLEWMIAHEKTAVGAIFLVSVVVTIILMIQASWSGKNGG